MVKQLKLINDFYYCRPGKGARSSNTSLYISNGAFYSVPWKCTLTYIYNVVIFCGQWWVQAWVLVRLRADDEIQSDFESYSYLLFLECFFYFQLKFRLLFLLIRPVMSVSQINLMTQRYDSVTHCWGGACSLYWSKFLGGVGV